MKSIFDIYMPLCVWAPHLRNFIMQSADECDQFMEPPQLWYGVLETFSCQRSAALENFDRSHTYISVEYVLRRSVLLFQNRFPKCLFRLCVHLVPAAYLETD